ncbi:1,4-dihydroxy-6-naphthoate synthase [Deminuibacter soli]|uniref:1,4-dihydroxy-6-naphtoate synthase n=2 Tax=Deminuibacter soli TaxID=2291815 RepID=A0A3E1ND29_9BACT|nr:1,4-dihydroxy-6-naphthoate synthase [Deminuibacter soli]
MKLTLGFSPCPNDTFIFDALVNKKIDTGDLEFDVVLEDVQTLNKWALEGKLDFSKISYGVLPLILPNYIVLNSGSALGKGVGPLLIAREPLQPGTDVSQLTIAIPGENTTAHMLFSLAYPGIKTKKFKVFNEIEDAVLSGEADAGVIIHENRFTYQQRGLVKWMDLGDFWEKETGVPIPLGGIVAKRSLPLSLIQQVDELIRVSVGNSFAYYPDVSEYVRSHAQEMSEDVMRQHIDLYVNNFSIDLEQPGRDAIHRLMEVYKQLHPGQPAPTAPVFA